MISLSLSSQFFFPNFSSSSSQCSQQSWNSLLRIELECRARLQFCWIYLALLDFNSSLYHHRLLKIGIFISQTICWTSLQTFQHGGSSPESQFKSRARFRLLVYPQFLSTKSPQASFSQRLFYFLKFRNPNPTINGLKAGLPHVAQLLSGQSLGRCNIPFFLVAAYQRTSLYP